MEKENTFLNFRCIWDRLTFLHALAFTVLSFSSASMASDANFLMIPALGRAAQLGFLYDERTDQFRPISVFSKAIPPEAVLETQNTDVATQTQETNTYDQKIQLLEIGLNAAANILVRNTKVRGTAGLLEGWNHNFLVQQQTLLRTHHTVDENLQVFYNDLRPFFNGHLLQHRHATHIVSGISWGSSISVTLQTTATPGVNAEDLSDAFYDEFQKIKGRPSALNKMIDFNFTIDIKSDIPLTGPVPTATSNVAILLNKMSQLINETKGGKGVPLQFTLTPLSELRSHLNVQTIFNNPVHKITKSTLRSLSIIFDDIASSEKRINELYQKTYLQLNCLPTQSREKIADMRTNFLNYKKKVADDLKETLVNVRSGLKTTSTFTDLAEEFERSNFSSKNIKNKIRKFDDIIGKLALCRMLQASYSDIEYFNSNQNLIPRISENCERPIYILFIKTEFKISNPVKYTEDLSTFLKTLYVPSNKLFLVDCDGDHVFCSNLNQSEIQKYKNGKLMNSPDLKHRDVNEDRNLENRFLELENNITILHSLIEQLKSELQHHINDERVNYCASNPCKNNRVCRSGVTSFNCTYPSAFNGPTCNANVNECESTLNPCENGGRCIDEIGGFTCVCPLPFAGQKCQENLDLCRINQCQNGASCITSSNYLDFICSCADGFNGKLCELDINDCLLNERCQNGGKCVDGINSYTCACAEGYEGPDCATVTNNCVLNDSCLNGGTCVNGISSYSCICSDGFAGNNCQNVNKCQYPGTCDPPSDAENCHRCRNGFVKDAEDDTRCKYANSNASLIISSWTDIRMISLDGLSTQMTQNADEVYGTDYNFRTNTIFWFSVSYRKIHTSPIHGDAGRKRIFHDSLSWLDGIAVDWVHEHLYWVDTERNQIVVINFNGTMKKVLFNDGLSDPTSIAVNPLNGWMYWSDRGTHRIERAGLDGSRREVILQTNMNRPYGLVVDFVDSRLFWAQGKNPSSIWSCKFDGSDRKLIFTASSSQFASSDFWKIATYDKYVYFIEWNSKTVYKVNRCNGEELSLVFKSNTYLQDIKIFEATLQPEGENLCSKRIGHCSHFCFPIPVPSPGNGSVTTTTCACPYGLSLLGDQQNCG